jgi:hypothetical protein
MIHVMEEPPTANDDGSRLKGGLNSFILEFEYRKVVV